MPNVCIVESKTSLMSLLILLFFILCKSLLNLTDRMGNCMDFQGESASITAPSLALSMVNVVPGYFSGLTFGVSLSSTVNPEVRCYDYNYMLLYVIKRAVNFLMFWAKTWTCLLI